MCNTLTSHSKARHPFGTECMDYTLPKKKDQLPNGTPSGNPQLWHLCTRSQIQVWKEAEGRSRTYRFLTRKIRHLLSLNYGALDGNFISQVRCYFIASLLLQSLFFLPLLVVYFLRVSMSLKNITKSSKPRQNNVTEFVLIFIITLPSSSYPSCGAYGLFNQDYF